MHTNKTATAENKPRLLARILPEQPPYQRKLQAGLLLVSFVLFFVFALLMLRNSDLRYRAELRTLGRQTIQQARNTSDDLLLGVFRFGLQSVTADPTVTHLMYSDGFDTNDAIAAQNLYEDIQNYNDYVDNIYIVNFENQSVLTNIGRIGLDNFCDQELIDCIENSPVSSLPVRYIPRTAKVRSSGGTLSEERVWTVIFHPSYKGAFVMNVDYNRYTGLLNIPSTSKYLNNCIVNGYGQVLVASDDTQFGADMSDSPLLAAVRAQPSKEGSFAYIDEKTRTHYTIYYIQNAYLGLTYLSCVEEMPFGLGNEQFFTILRWSLLFLLLSLLGSLALSARLYRPIKNLSATLNVTPAAGDEFAHIRAAYTEMQQRSEQMESGAEAHRRAEEKRMLLKWIEPQAVTRRYRAEQYDELNTYFSGLLYCCVLLNIDAPGQPPIQTEELGLIKYSLTNMMEELAEGKYRLKSLDYAVNQTVYLCNFDGADNAERDALRGSLQTIQTVMRDHFHVTVTAAVGPTVDDTEDLPASLLAAKRAAARRFADGDGQLVFCTADTLAAPTEPRYPEQEEAALFQAVRAGDRAEAVRGLNAFFAAVRPCPLDSIVLSLLQLDLAFRRMESANHLDAAPLDASTFYFSSARLGDSRKLFEERIDALIEVITQLRESNAEKLIARVNQLVEENICDPNLSVTSLADEVKLSVNYLRNVYKEATGESLSGHITAAKLALICQMLENTDKSIQDISEQLGFTTRNYFFTFFKKHMGTTPKQYRLMHGNLTD